MDEATFNLLLSRAREQWLRYERYRLGFQAKTRGCRQRAQWLAWMTIGFGFLTTLVSGLAAASESPPPALAIAGVILAAATTAVATVRQTFNWEAKAQKHFASYTEVYNLQRSIQDYLECIARRTKPEDQTFMSVLEGRFQNLLDAESLDPEEYDGKASAAWEASFVSKLQLWPAGGAAAGFAAANDSPEPEQADAPDLQPVARGS